MKAYFNGESLSFGGSGSGGDSIPQGVIVIWSGSADNIPDGWALCDGTNGTPDLQGRFILGSSDNHAVGSTGGEENVTLTVEQMPSHSHQVNTAWASAYEYTIVAHGSNTASGPYFSSNNSGISGSSQPHNNMPPYYTLCYIIKL